MEIKTKFNIGDSFFAIESTKNSKGELRWFVSCMGFVERIHVMVLDSCIPAITYVFNKKGYFEEACFSTLEEANTQCNKENLK